MTEIAMEATYEDPAQGSCLFVMKVTTDVPPEAGPWTVEACEQVLMPYIEFVIAEMEAWHFVFSVDGAAPES